MNTKREKENERDVELLRAIARGDREAYAALYDRHGAILLGLLSRILRSRSEAEDVLQEVFLQVWLRAGDFDARRGGAFPWLALLARSRALDRLSTLGSRARWHTAETPDDARGALPDPADEASLAEEGRLLRQALGDIPSSEQC